MLKHFTTCLFTMLVLGSVQAQWISDTLPNTIGRNENYLFYFHGGVVTVLGDNAINQSRPEWGPYQYSMILGSLRARGFNVISERRIESIHDTVYVNKLCSQIDQLLRSKVKVRRIIVVGASAGSHIVLLASSRLKNNRLKFVVMGGCWPDTYKDYEKLELQGRFLSIIESSDPHGTCEAIFKNRKNLRSFEEITLHTNLSHGFIYKGYKEWIDPVVEFFRE